MSVKMNEKQIQERADFKSLTRLVNLHGEDYEIAAFGRLQSQVEVLREALQQMVNQCGSCKGVGKYTRAVTLESVETFDCEFCEKARKVLEETKG